MAITIHGSLAEACTQWTHMRGRRKEKTGGQDLKKKKKNDWGKGEGNEEKRWQKEQDIISCSYYNEVIPQRV